MLERRHLRRFRLGSIAQGSSRADKLDACTGAGDVPRQTRRRDRSLSPAAAAA
jgi:hypothetical protein